MDQNKRISTSGVLRQLIMVSALLGLPLLAHAQTAADNPADVLKFKWAVLLRTDDGEAKTLDFSNRVSVTNGDAVRVFLEPVTNVYLYLFMFDSQKQLKCLFPPDPSQYDKPLESGKQYLFPSETKWFVMDKQKGTEKFFLLASTKRLASLEELTRKLLAAPSDGEIKARLLDDIQLVRRDKTDLKSPVEKGVPIAGTVVAVTRGETPQATMTAATGFYSRTLRLEHE